jgi:predicted acylesterase/phospholipase RssA
MSKPIKRAITLAGGGPACGLHIGVLERLRQEGIEFEIWGLSCIGAWVGTVYNQWADGDPVEQTYKFFRDGIFRDDDGYARFPINTVFGPDLKGNTEAVMRFMMDPKSYDKIWLPDQFMKQAMNAMAFFTGPNRSSEGDLNNLILNSMAANPLMRFMSSMMFLSETNGLSRIYYPDSTFLNSINFENLYKKDTFLYHNAWNLTKQRMEQFANKDRDGYNKMTHQTLCACSALPYIEAPIEMNGDVYCEGALIDTVNFQRLVEDHPDLDEIWVSRIVDPSQVHPPKNMHDALANLCMLFAGVVGDDDVKLFRYHAKYGPKPWNGRIVEIQVDNSINYEWSRSNLDQGRKDGYWATDVALQKYKFTLADWKNYRERLEASVGKPGYDRSVAEAEEMIQKLTPSPRPRSHGATVAA